MHSTILDPRSWTKSKNVKQERVKGREIKKERIEGSQPFGSRFDPFIFS